MSNIIDFTPKAPVSLAPGFDAYDNETAGRRAFSFDIVQGGPRGMVLIDACVPAEMATEFLRMLVAYQERAATTLN